MFSPDGMVAEARRWADETYHEGPNNANIFSAWQYGAAYNPWCDSFVSYCAYVGGGFRFSSHCAWGTKGEMNVGHHHWSAIQDGIWRDRSHVARPGDLVVFNFFENGRMVYDAHIEMVLSDQGGPTLATIGGNTGDAVRYRLRYRANVAGFVALTEAGQNAPAPVIVPPKPQEVIKVQQHFNPPVPLVDELTIAGKGAWGLTADGGVRTFYGNYYGSMAGNPAFKGRHAARIVKAGTPMPGANPPLKAYPPGVMYEVIATSGERYLPAPPK